MFEFSTVWRKNRSTFYDFETSEQRAIWPLLVCEFLLSVFLLIIFPYAKDGVLQAVLTVYSILIGFSFSVLFYLVSISETPIDEVNTSLEAQKRTETSNRLRKELFYNVSYFACVAFLVVVLSLAFVIGNSFSMSLSIAVSFLVELLSSYAWLAFAIDLLGLILVVLMKIAFYFFIIDSMFSFVRIIFRVNFYFERKISDGI